MTTNATGYHAHVIKYRNTQIIHATVIFWLAACFCFAFLNQDILPAKYFFDSEVIAQNFGHVDKFTIGGSFVNTALFYDLLLLSQSARVTAFVTSLVFSVFIFKCFSPPQFLDKRGMHNVVVFAFACVVGAVYLAQYSKESLVMLTAFLFFGLSKTRKQQFLWVLIAVIYATYFREYWLLVLVFYFYYQIVFKFSRSVPWVLLSVVLAFLVLAIAFQFVLGVELAYYRYAVNDTRAYTLNANTMIMPVLPTGNVLLEWLNAVIQFFLMFFPFPLLTGNPLYLLFFLVVASIGIRLIGVMQSLIRSRQLSLPTRQVRCLALILSFVTIQSIFEPDYGSYIKHLTPMLPLILYVLCWHQQWRAQKQVIHAQDSSHY